MDFCYFPIYYYLHRVLGSWRFQWCVFHSYAFSKNSPNIQLMRFSLHTWRNPFGLLMTLVLRICFLRIFARPKKMHEPRTGCSWHWIFGKMWKIKVSGVISILKKHKFPFSTYVSFDNHFERTLKHYNLTDIIPCTLSSAFYLSYCRMTTTLFVLYDISALSKEGFISFSLLILLIWLVTTSMIYSTWVTSKLGGVN